MAAKAIFWESLHHFLELRALQIAAGKVLVDQHVFRRFLAKVHGDVLAAPRMIHWVDRYIISDRNPFEKVPKGSDLKKYWIGDAPDWTGVIHKQATPFFEQGKIVQAA